MSERVDLKVNGQNIPLNRFVNETFFYVIEGLLKSLDGVPAPVTKIEILINKNEKEEQ